MIKMFNAASDDSDKVPLIEMIFLFIPEQFFMPDFGTTYPKIYKNSMTGLIYKN